MEYNRMLFIVAVLCGLIYYLACHIDDLRWSVNALERREMERTRERFAYYANTNGLKDAQD